MSATFQEFMASRVEHADLSTLPELAEELGCDEPVHGFVYLGNTSFPKWLAIEPDGTFWTGDMVGRFDNLQAAEEALYAWEG